MSKSRKKNPHFAIVSMRHESKAWAKSRVNKAFRRKLKRGVYDDETSSLTLHKRSQDLSWTFDVFTLYHSPETYGEYDWYKQAMRK